MRLNKTEIESLPTPAEGFALHWDDELRGFGVRVTAKGTISYIVQRRSNGKEYRVTLGQHGEPKEGRLTPAAARKKALSQIGQMINGDWGADQKRQEALSVTLSDVVESYVENRSTGTGEPLKPRTIADIRYHLRSSFGDWADRPVAGITREDVSTWYSKRVKASVAQANQAARVLRALIAYAAATYRQPDGARIIADNPVDVLRERSVLWSVKARNNKVPIDKLGDWWGAVQDSRRDPALSTSSRSAADLVAVLALTGLRLGEARSIRWDQVDLDDRSLKLFDTKNRSDITLPLADLVVEILQERQNRSVYVFPPRSKGMKLPHLKDCRGHLQKLTEITGVEVTAHDLRRTFRDVARECRIELWRVKALMNHRQSNDVTLGSYTDLEDVRYLRDDVNTIARFYETARAGR